MPLNPFATAFTPGIPLPARTAVAAQAAAAPPSAEASHNQPSAQASASTAAPSAETPAASVPVSGGTPFAEQQTSTNSSADDTLQLEFEDLFHRGANESDNEPSTVDEEPTTSSPPDSPRPLQRQSIEISKTFSVGEQLVDYEHASTSGRPEHELPGKRGPDDFELLRVVGKGAFGKVFQVRDKLSGKIFAMKVMRKDRILEREHSTYVRAERDILTSVVHPYIVRMRFSFQTTTKLYLVLDFINGGHLFYNLYRQGIFDEKLTCLYAAEMVLAISHLHSLGVVHRDLKPENVLLDSDGHIRITDFGLAKGDMTDDADHRTNSLIGTMEYMAPEIVAGRGHGKAVDWWSIGILVYEMLAGRPPFNNKSRGQLQKQIIAAKLKLPPYLSSDAQSLLKSLLQKEAPKRLGYGPDGSAAVKAHPFFRSINWKILEQRQVPSPFKPEVGREDSTENFDRIWTDLPAEDSPCGSPSAPTESAFAGFTYSAPSLLTEHMLA